MKLADIQHLQAEIETRNENLAQKDQEIATKDQMIQQVQDLMQVQNYVQLTSGACEHSVCVVQNLWFGKCGVLYCSLWAIQTINFQYMHMEMFKRT